MHCFYVVDLKVILKLACKLHGMSNEGHTAQTKELKEILC